MEIEKSGAAFIGSPREVRRYRAANPSFRFLACLSMLVLAFASLAPAQQASKAERKLITRVEPEYPPVLKVRQIGGTVRLEVIITPKGTVKSASLLGGNPILAESAITAVKKWIYAPADAATTTEVSLEFNPYR